MSGILLCEDTISTVYGDEDNDIIAGITLEYRLYDGDPGNWSGGPDQWVAPEGRNVDVDVIVETIDRTFYSEDGEVVGTERIILSTDADRAAHADLVKLVEKRFRGSYKFRCLEESILIPD